MQRISKISVAILVLGVLVTPVFLQSQITTGTLRGFVVDDSKAPLPGATIEIEATSLMNKRSSVTDARGFYRFLYLPPGKYTICVRLEGFETCWMRGVTVQVAQTSTADIVLKMGKLESNIEVRAQAPVIDRESSSRSYNITKELIDTVPFSPRMNFTAAFQALPGVSGSNGDSPLVNASVITINMQPGKSYFFSTIAYQDDSYENKIQIDGMDINDTMSGLNYFSLNTEAIEEMDVKTAGAPAEYGNARSAFMNVITKSGGNSLQGSVLFQYQPRSFVTTNIEGTSSQIISYAIPSITLSGPILKDKIWFLASYKYDNENYQYPLTSVEKRIERTTGSHMPYLKLTWQPGAKHTLSFVYMQNKSSQELGSFPDVVYSRLAAAQTNEKGGEMFSGTWRWLVSDSTYFNFVAGFNSQVQNNVSDNQLPRMTYTSIWKGVTTLIDQGFGENYYSTRNNILISGDLTWFNENVLNTGAHEVKFGFEIRPRSYVERSRKYWEDTYGNYRYWLGQDYASYGLSQPYIWQAQSAYPGNEYFNNYVVSNQCVYLRDQWVVTPDLTLSLGLRWERSKMDMWNRDKMPASMLAISPNMLENVMMDDSGLAPRFGLTYNMKNIGVFKLSWGKYFEQVGGSGGQYPVEIAFNTYRTDPADFGKGPEALKIYTQGTLAYSPNYNLNLEMEYNNEFVASFERELFWNLAVETSFIYRNTFCMTKPEVNAIFQDGKFVGRTFPDFDDIFVKTTLHGDDNVAQWLYKGLQFNLKRNFTGNWGLMVNYTHMWRDYNKVKWATGEVEQYVYAQPGDLTMKSYGLRWTFKASFFYRLPFDIMFSSFIWGQSGQWLNDVTGAYAWNTSAPIVTLSNGRKVTDIEWVTENSYYAGKKYGSQGRMTEQMWTANVRFLKGINIKGVRTELSVDIFNLLNTATYTSWATVDVRHPNYSLRRNPQSPRSAQINLRMKF